MSRLISDYYEGENNQEVKSNYQLYQDYRSTALPSNFVELVQKKFVKEIFNTPSHYDNSKGSLYKFAEDHKLNAWEFDILKRVIRCRKKGQFLEDIDKTIEVLKLYKKEYKK